MSEERARAEAAEKRVAELARQLAHEVAWHDSNVDSLHEQSHPRDLDRIATLETALRQAREALVTLRLSEDDHDSVMCPALAAIDAALGEDEQ